MARSMKEVHTINYYPINEGAARRAKEMNSFSDYKEGSATAEYRAMVDKAAAIAEKQKSRVDPMYHEKIDHLLDTYARKLAENMNQGFAIDARVPSVMIAGPANFPVGKKEKQNRARDSNMEEWRYIQGLLDKIRSTGMGGISADDPAAIEKLQKKLDGLERSQLIMKEVNAYYRKHGKLDGCALLSPDQIEKLKASMAANRRSDPRPFESYQLTNNNAEIGAYDITADELLAGTDTAKTESKTAQAQMLILELLADGKRMPSAELEKAVNERGISSRTMRTAKSRIGDRLVTEKDGTAWVCYLRN